MCAKKHKKKFQRNRSRLNGFINVPSKHFIVYFREKKINYPSRPHLILQPPDFGFEFPKFDV